MITIPDYFNSLRSRARVPDKLRLEGYEDEANTLICCYLDAVAGEYYQADSTSLTFKRALCELTGNDYFQYIHLRHLLSHMKAKNVFRDGFDRFEEYLALHANELVSQNKLLTLAEEMAMSPDQLLWVRENGHKGSIADVVYTYKRCPAVHKMQGYDINFGSITHNGVAAPKIDFPLIRQAYLDMISNVEKECVSLGRFPWQEP